MSIPVKSVISINPGVIDSGSSDITLSLLTLTENPLMPFGTQLGFPTQSAVAQFFGDASDEASVATTYFSGYTNSFAKPSLMTFAAYASVAVAAWLTSGSLLGVPLSQLQTYEGTLTITIDGVMETSNAIDLSAATSYSNAAMLIAAGFTGKTKVPTVAFNALKGTFIITSPTTGATSTITAASGALATDLLLTVATAATLSIGVAADTPNSAMTRITAQGQNFAVITSMFEFLDADKTNFAVWANGQNSEYCGVIWDTNAQAAVQGSTTCFGALAKLAAYDGIICIGGDPNYAANNGLNYPNIVRNAAFFFAAYAASINFNQLNGRVIAAFRSQSGLTPTVVDQGVSSILTANGYSFTGQYANRVNVTSVKFANGALPGKWKWADNFLNQIWMSNGFADDLWDLITTQGAVNYNDDGYGDIRTALTAGTITTSLNFGAIRTGVVLSASQAEEVNTAAGQNVASIIQTQGWYLQIVDPGPDARNARQTPIINFWYTDGGAIQQITLNSFDIL